MLRKLTVLALFMSLLAAGIPAASASSGRAGSYIVVLKDSVGDPRAVAREHSRSQNARLGYVYEHALKGYSATMSDVAAARIANDRRVSYVEADGVVHKVATTQAPVTWGLDRIDQQDRPLSGSYTYESTGAGVRAYIIDTGIRVTHSDFGGRAVSGTDTVDGDNNSDDCDGHGTHVAGTVGSSTYGVAKGVTLVGVRVLNCSGSGTWSGVIAGVDWVTNNAVKPAVANMSLGGGFSSSLNQAVRNSTTIAGITYAVAAGNGNNGGKAQDACDYSPASELSALTVGATNSSDSKASWSNYGSCLDLFAPGVSITSTTMGGGTATWSGTSMASPHVAGVAALYLQGSPGASAATVSDAITGSATREVVSNAGPGSPNLLLYSLLTPATPPPPPDPVAPVAVDDSATAVTGETVTIDVLANDSDANNDPLTVTNLTTATGGSADYSEGATAVTYTAPATADTYSFMYTANDGTADSNVVTVTVTVTDPPPPPAGATAATIGYSTSGGRLADKHLAVSAVLTDDGGNRVANTSIEVWIYLNGSHSWTGTGTTLGDGSVTWEIKNAPSGTYTTTVKNVAGASWTGTTQDGDLNTGFTK